MTTLAQLRKAALSLPETEEGQHFGRVAFSVRGKGFASVTKERQVLLNLREDEAAELAQAYLAGEVVTRRDRVVGARVPLADINGQQLNHWVRRAWFHRAPRRLAAELTRADQVDVGTGDLPAGIDRPATRALHGAGATSLDDVARLTRDEVAALHGVGQKAVRLLEEALTERGSTFRAP